MPKFKIDFKKGMKDDLISLGASAPFSDFANFTEISQNEGLKVSSVIHQTFIDVNENGTEAAAATGVVVNVRSVRPNAIDFVVNRPFMFIIHEKIFNTVLFIGKYVQP